MIVPLLDLVAQYRTLAGEIGPAIESILSSGQFILSSAVESFETRFAEFIGTKCAIGVGSGLDALRLTLVGLGVGPGDEVIMPANTFIATALAASAAGTRPVLVDCRSDTYNLDPTLIEAAITARTKAVIAVHLTGLPAEVDRMREIAQRHRLFLIEDASQAHGATYRGSRCGSLGDAGCFSFHPGKNLGAYGDGGMVTTNNLQLAEHLRQLRNYGARHKYEHVVQGGNSRLDALQAAVLEVKLRHLEAWNRARAGHAALYRRLLQGVGDFEFQPAAPDSTHVYHLMAVTSAARDGLRRHLARRGIQTAIHYPKPIHLQPAYRDLGYVEGDLKCTERLASRLLSLPVYPELTAGQIEYVAAQIAGFFEQRAAGDLPGSFKHDF